MKLHKKRIRWGRILLAFFVMSGAVFGLLNGALTKAFEGDYGDSFTTTSEDGLSITVVSVEQGGSNLVPHGDGNGGYYFNVVNNTESVIVDARVEGMQPGESYYYNLNERSYYPYSSNRVYLTSENNGDVIFEELYPRIYFQEEDDCHGGCYDDPFDGVYSANAAIYRSDGSYGVGKDIALHPANVGSRNIDIVSVQQNNVDLGFTNNEYQIVDYNTPVEVTYKFKNLEIGGNYAVDIGNDSYDFVANATEKMDTREISLNYVNRHTEIYINISGPGNDEQVPLYFKVADANFKPLGDIVIAGISQGGIQLDSDPDTSSGWRREYTFEANDAQGLTVDLRSTRVTDDLNYYISYIMYGAMGGSLSSDGSIEVTGEELESGVPLPVSAAFGMGDYSPLTLRISISTTENSHDYGSQRVVYQNYGEYSSSDAIYFTFYEDENVPRFSAAIFYSDGTRIESDVISPALHYAGHPLTIEVLGERYNDEQTYDIRAKAMNENREVIYDHIFSATGAQLNEGIPFTLEDLTLALPEFDPDDSGSGGYEGNYDLSLEIDGLRQVGTMYYAYEGWVNSLVTFDGGEVAAMGAGGSMGGTIYMTNNGLMIRKSSLDASRGATLNYLGNGFDESLNYNYAVYYNGDAGDEYECWSAVAGSLIAEGTLTGVELNNEGYSINLLAPSNESASAKYTLVLTTGGKLVKIVHDHFIFTEEPKIESFKFTADSDSFMQTDWLSYRVAKDTDIVATLNGNGFEDETEYKVWVSYEGYRFGEEQDEWGYSYPEYVDLTDLNNSVTVTGAQLNAGYTYTLNYVEAFDSVNYVEIGFAVSDIDVEEPNWYDMGNGSYAGHTIHVDYVNDDEVFRDNGYQINDDGTITDVSQPDDPHGPDEPIPVIDRAVGVASWTVEGGTLTVVSEKPVRIVGHRENGDWVLLYGWDATTSGDAVTNHYSVGDCTEVVVALKGNLKDDDTTIDLLDANVIYRSQLNPSSPAYRALTPAEEILADLNGDHNVDLLDANVIYRSQLNPSSPAYQAIPWDE